MTTKIKLLLSKLCIELSDIWNKSKMYLLAAAAIVGVFFWRRIKAALLVYFGQKELAADKKEDAGLAKSENTANIQADALMAKSKNETAADDWNKS